MSLKKEAKKAGRKLERGAKDVGGALVNVGSLGTVDDPFKKGQQSILRRGAHQAPPLPDISQDLSAIDKEKQDQSARDKLLFSRLNELYGAAEGGGGPSSGAIGQEQQLSQQFVADTERRYREQQSALAAVLDKYRQNAMLNLSSGSEGEAMRRYFNRLGILNSGAFNTELANRFGEIQRGSEVDLMRQGLRGTDASQRAAELGYGNISDLYSGRLGDLSGATKAGYQRESDLSGAGLERRFGLEDLGYESAFERDLARRRQRRQREDALIGLGGDILGSAAGGYFGGRYR